MCRSVSIECYDEFADKVNSIFISAEKEKLNISTEHKGSKEAGEDDARKFEGFFEMEFVRPFGSVWMV